MGLTSKTVKATNQKTCKKNTEYAHHDRQRDETIDDFLYAYVGSIVGRFITLYIRQDLILIVGLNRRQFHAIQF